ncbi:Hypothetical protein TPENAI_P0002 [Tenacibaculum litopenaei]
MFNRSRFFVYKVVLKTKEKKSKPLLFLYKPLVKHIILPQSTLIKVFFYVQEFSNRIIK